MTECCENCKFYKRIKLSKRKIERIVNNGIISGVKIVKSRGLFEESHYCDVLTYEEDGFALEVESNDMCEMFKEKENKNAE